MKRFFLTVSFLFASAVIFAQEAPKLVVGLAIDQMRWDYLHRFANKYGKDGFKRLLAEGFSCNNTLINYIPTYTAVGHTSMWTGTVPSVHGIAGNNYMKDGRWTYCTEDTLSQTIDNEGITSTKAGKNSPRNLLVTTVGDELKLFSNFRSKVIGISLKDRASILPAGHTADAAYWLDDKTGHFITSTFYRKDLPKWLKDFNKKELADSYLSKDWKTLYNIKEYTESLPDESPYEGEYAEGVSTTFPYKLKKLYKQLGYGLIKSTPAGTTLTFDMAKAAIEGEKMGSNEDYADLLALSISTTDYIGHQFGTHAIEIEDAYLRLDKELGEFLSFLDSKIGKGKYIFFLTADHGGAHNISFLQDHKIPADSWDYTLERDKANQHLSQRFGKNLKYINTLSNYQVFFNKESIASAGLNFKEVKEETVNYFKQDKQYAYVIDMERSHDGSVPAEILSRAINGYNRLRSGEIFLLLQPGYYSEGQKLNIKGTTHGNWNPYDAHIPCIFMGTNIPKGHTNKETHITDIAPTICALLKIQAPNGNIGSPISEIVDAPAFRTGHNK